MKKYILSVLAIGIILSCCISSGWVLGVPLIREFPVRQTLNVYDNAAKIYEDWARYGANSATKGLYYWSPDPIEDVRNYYETFTPPFLSSQDDYGKWFITPLTKNVSSAVESTFSPDVIITLGGFCNYKDRYDCITVALVDASQQDIYRLAVSSVTGFRRSVAPPEFASIPAYGTLIIYNYYVINY